MRVLPRVWDAEEAAEGEPLVPALRMHAAALGILSAPTGVGSCLCVFYGRAVKAQRA